MQSTKLVAHPLLHCTSGTREFTYFINISNETELYSLRNTLMILPGGLERLLGRKRQWDSQDPSKHYLCFLGACTRFPWGQIFSAPLRTIHSLAACPLLSWDNLLKGDTGLIPGQRTKIPQAPRQLSPHTLAPVLGNGRRPSTTSREDRGPQLEKPVLQRRPSTNKNFKIIIKSAWILQ